MEEETYEGKAEFIVIRKKDFQAILEHIDSILQKLRSKPDGRRD